MPLTVLPSAVAPTPPASPGNRASERSADQDSGQTSSFGEAMTRSREASRERTAEPAVRPAPSKPARRPADAEEPPMQNSADFIAALLATPLENRLDATTNASAAGAAAIATTAGAISGSTVDAARPAESPGTQVAPELADLLPTAPAGLGDAFVMMAGNEDAPAALAPALAQDTPSRQGVLMAANLGTQAALAPALDQETQSRQGVLMAANLGTQAALAPALAVSVSTSADPVPVLARMTPSSHAIPMTTDPLAVTAQAGAASAGLSDPSAGPGDDGAKSRAAALDRRVDLPLETADRMPFSVEGGLALPAGAALQQPGNASAPNAPSPVTSALLLPNIGSSEWAKALGQQVIHLSKADRQVAELQLNPPGLGPLKVTLSMNDQQMQAAFISTHSSVRAAVELALPQLRALLAESGISLGQTSVGSDSQPQTAFANGQNDSGSQSSRPGSQTKNAGVAALFATPPVALQRSSSQGMRIDTYA